MPRDFRVHLEDILGAIGKIKRYTKGLSKQDFAGDDKTLDGLRDILIHQYFGIDVDILWDIIQNKLPALEVSVSTLLRE